MIGTRYHFDGRDKQGKAIIIDLCDLTSIDGMKRVFPFELMVMRPSGREIACSTYSTLSEAAKAYGNAVTLYALTKGKSVPLKGKYAKLRDDYAAALDIGKQAAQGEDDGGTCNFDSPALYLPRWTAALVEQAAKEAGGDCFSWNSYGGKRFVFSTPSVGQANRNAKAAEAMTEEFSRRGYDAFCYQQAD